MVDRSLFSRRPVSLPEAFQQLLTAAPDPLALIDTGGQLLAANPALARLAGPTLSLRPGTPVAKLIAPAQRPALQDRIAAAATGQATPAPLLVKPADPGAARDTAWALTCSALPPGALEGRPLLLLIQDRTAEQRAIASAAATSRLELVGRLAGGIAHDFNNLLSVVLCSTDAARAVALPEPAATELGQIEDAARRGASLVKQLLAFARQQQLQPRVLDVNAAVDDLAPLLRRLLGSRMRLELDLGETARWVLVDPVQLDQIILNLAVNAREAMPEGGTLRIATDRIVVLRPDNVVPPGRWVVLEVADTGQGIPPEILPRLFEPFFTTRPDKGGTGLGLATVQGIVEQSGGLIAVDSKVGEGTRFRVYLPRQEAPAAVQPVVPPAVQPAAPKTPPAAARATVRSAQQAPTIWLVEDEAPLRRLGTRLLERAGYVVCEAESAEAALALATDDAAPPDALVSDVAMPGLDGVELAQRLRARWPQLPVLLLSGYAERAQGGRLQGLGMRFLAKPYIPADLVKVLGETIGQAEVVPS